MDACRFFLDVYNGRVYFIHQTAKDYLLGSSSSDEPTPKPDWLGRFSIEDCHAALAESCSAYLSLPFRTKSKFVHGHGAPSVGSTHTSSDTADHHLWDFDELEFSNYATAHWQHHVSQGQILVHPLWKGQVPSTNGCVGYLRALQSWDQGQMTFVRISAVAETINLELLAKHLRSEASRPVRGVHLDIDAPRHICTDTLGLSIDGEGRYIITDHGGKPLQRIRRIPADEPNAIESLAKSLQSIALVRTIKALSHFVDYSPLPKD